MIRWFALVLVALVLIGCNHGRGGIACPTTREHSSEFWRAASVELEQAFKTSPRLVQLLKEYEITKDAIKVCIMKRK